MTLNRILSCCILPLFGLVSLCAPASAAPQSERAAVAGNIPAAVAAAKTLGHLSGTTLIRVALTLPLRNQAALTDLLGRLYDRADPAYGHYLTPAQFAAQFSPTEADYAAVADFARAQGLTVTGTHANRLLLDVSGRTGEIEAAFGIRLNRYQAADGHVFRAPDAAPTVPRALAGRLTGVVGLSDDAVRHPHNIRHLHDIRMSLATARRPEVVGQAAVGTGPQVGCRRRTSRPLTA